MLRGLLRSIERGAPSWNVEDPDSLRETLVALEGRETPTGEVR